MIDNNDLDCEFNIRKNLYFDTKCNNSDFDIIDINDNSSHFDTLYNIGFSNVYIIDASYCFTSFLAVK